MTKSILCEEALPDQRSLYSTCAGVRTIFSIAADPIPNSPSWTMQPQGTNEIEYIQWSINERFEKLRCILIRTNKVNEPSHSMICKRLYLFSYFKLLPSFPSLLSSTSLSLFPLSFFLSSSLSPSHLCHSLQFDIVISSILFSFSHPSWFSSFVARLQLYPYYFAVIGVIAINGCLETRFQFSKRGGGRYLYANHANRKGWFGFELKYEKRIALQHNNIPFLCITRCDPELNHPPPLIYHRDLDSCRVKSINRTKMRFKLFESRELY